MSLCVWRTSRKTLTPNAETLLMNPGDTVATTIKDTPQGLLASVTDFTTHQTGYIVARYGGTLASPVLRNPQTRRWC